jgi:hypothetical protein
VRIWLQRMDINFGRIQRGMELSPGH